MDRPLVRPEGIADITWAILNNEPYNRRYDWLEAQGHLLSGSMLDVGCGQGYATALMAGFVGWLTAVDQEPGLVETAAKMMLANDVPNVHVQVGDAYHLPFPRQSFDCAMCTDVLEHLDHPEVAAAELARVLHPGGTLIVTCPAFGAMRIPGHVQDFTGQALCDLLMQAGFGIVTWQEEQPFQYVLAVRQ